VPIDRIAVRGARQHNLKDLDLDLPRYALVVMTGPSGSGKSSLAFDTLYAEGQRRYVESLSAYARQFLEQMERPEVDLVEGLSPSIAIDQKTTSRNPRSTVGTVTEIYDYLRLLYARVGVPHCPRCDRTVASQTSRQIVDRVQRMKSGSKLQILAPVVRGRKGEHKAELARLSRSGFVRARIDGRVHELAGGIDLARNKLHDIEVVVDRLVLRAGVDRRLLSAVHTALQLGDGMVIVNVVGEGDHLFSNRLSCVVCGLSVPDLEPRSFSFNSPRGACAACDGLGTDRRVDPERVVPDDTLALLDGAIAPWRGAAYPVAFLRALARHEGVNPKKAWRDLPAEFRQLVLFGPGDGKPLKFRVKGDYIDKSLKRGFLGAVPWLERALRTAESPRVLKRLEPFLHDGACSECLGARLRPESLAVRLDDRSIAELARLTIEEALPAIESLAVPERLQPVAEPILKEVRERLGFLLQVGLGYLSLDRTAGSLAGGESQRIRLATQIGTRLRGVLYVLDEPSIGLHARDNQRLIDALRAIRDLGNTVIVVEHDEETMRAADWVVDLGPGAGEQGGFLVSEGPPDAIERDPNSPTGLYLSGRREIKLPARRRQAKATDAGPDRLVVRGARHRNLRDIDVEIPLGTLVVVSGVSGSGKSTLIEETLYRALAKELHGATATPGLHRSIDGAEAVDKVIDITQDPIGRTPRSNPATYSGVFTTIRQLFAALPESKVRGYGPGRFSFNVAGGRCEGCQGAGVKKIEMHFLPDVYTRCDECGGRRYNDETLEVKFRGHSIADILGMTIDHAVDEFAAVPAIAPKLTTLQQVGLGYLRLGQPATTLSGGEAQRLKLARELSKRSTGRTLYLLDEPTTGLHFEDVARLLSVLDALVEQGNTVVVIEHNMEVIKYADWIIDLGPEGGAGGGLVVATGTPEEVAASEDSATALFLRDILSRQQAPAR
jgi:excinuclease ABC subunit A